MNLYRLSVIIAALGVLASTPAILLGHGITARTPLTLPAPKGESVDALLYSTMPSTREHRPEMVLDGDQTTSFQSTAGMSDGDDFLVLLSRPIPVQSLTVTTGDAENHDLLGNALLETSTDGIAFKKVSSFDSHGVAAAQMFNKPVMAIRIRLEARRGAPKLIIREISIKSKVAISHVLYGPGRGFVDVSQAPDLKGWADTAEKQMESFWADTAAMLYSFGLITPNAVNVIYTTGPGVTGVAATGGGVMTVNTKWCRAHPDDTGLAVHEMAHVVQSINAAAPGWLVEGTADYIRWVKFEPEHFTPRINVEKSTYHDAYRTSATFLAWCALNYDELIVTKLNDAARAGTYKNDLFRKYCGKDVDTLWAEFIAAYKADPTHLLQTPTSPAMMPRNLPQVQAGTSESVDLSRLFNLVGIVADGSKFAGDGGFDAEGSAFSATVLGGYASSRDVRFKFGKAGTANVLACAGNTIAVTGTGLKSFWLLASSIEGSHKDQEITVTYTDGSVVHFAQNFSDWYVPEKFPGESRAIRTDYRNISDGGKDTRPFFVYSYGYPLDPSKTLKSVTLPNDPQIRVLAISTAK